MRFLFVDAITSVQENQIHGERLFPATEPMQYCEPGARAIVAPGVVCEAMGQLASWLCLKRNGFTARPVFLFADSIANYHDVHPEETVTLSAELSEFTPESCRFSAEARVGGKLVQSMRDCTMSFMPLEDLEDPARTRERFSSLTSGGIRYFDDRESAFDFAGLITKVIAHHPGEEITVSTDFAASAPFYPDHFPRMNVTPVVILNEMIGQAASRLFALEAGARLKVRRIDNCKIRSFVRPGDTVETHVRTVGEESVGGRLFVNAQAEVARGAKRVLVAKWQFEVLGAQHVV